MCRQKALEGFFLFLLAFDLLKNTTDGEGLCHFTSDVLALLAGIDEEAHLSVVEQVAVFLGLLVGDHVNFTAVVVGGIGHE